jgi:hypothetical protein
MEVYELAGEGASSVMLARRLMPFAVALAIVALAAMVAGAHHSDVADPNDTKGTLDVQTVKLDHGKGHPPEWTVLTFSKWAARALWDRGFVFVFLDTEGKEAPEYYALIRSDGSSMLGDLRRVKTDKLIAALSVRRKTPNGVSVRVPLKKMKFGRWRWFYRWYVQTAFVGTKCKWTCYDLVPDGEPVVQWRPGMSPTPSPSSSPSASPDP